MQKVKVRAVAAIIVALNIAGVVYMDARVQSREINPASSEWTDTSPHRSAFAMGDGVRLNYLDWGGDGPPLVMVHGIANDPHIFDDLAPLLCDRFRVLAYARRGHGQSDAPAGPYDSKALVSDLRHFLDSLGIARANLLGWSMGGNEITEFAGRYPDRVDKLVYLEGGYDWSNPTFFKAFTGILAINSPEPSTLASLDALRTWFHAAWIGNNVRWTSALEAFLRDAVRVNAGGAIDPIPSVNVMAALLHTLGTWRRDYTKVRAPALAFYATSFFPTDRNEATLQQKLRAFEQDMMVPFRRASIERVSRELRGVTIEQISDRTHMSIGVQTPGALATSIREFLLSAPSYPKQEQQRPG